jgi:hypothetical protein
MRNPRLSFCGVREVKEEEVKEEEDEVMKPERIRA